MAQILNKILVSQFIELQLKHKMTPVDPRQTPPLTAKLKPKNIST